MASYEAPGPGTRFCQSTFQVRELIDLITRGSEEYRRDKIPTCRYHGVQSFTAGKVAIEVGLTIAVESLS